MLKNAILRTYGKEYFQFLTADRDDIYLVGRIDALENMLSNIGLEDEISEITTKISLTLKHRYSYENSKEIITNWLNKYYG